jgi:all-trans-retinol 13,14-reductase
MFFTIFLLFLLFSYSGYSYIHRYYLNFKQCNSSDNSLKIKEYSKVRFSNNKVKGKTYDSIIIGSGIGGLTTAGLLSKNGKRVLVLEQHYVAGGTMHTFDLKGVEHETGIHYVGNIDKRKPILDLITSDPIEWSQLGWEDKKTMIYDEIVIEDRHYKLPTGESNLLNYLTEQFPHQRKGLVQYFRLIKDAASKDLFFLLKLFPWKKIGNYIKYLQPDYYYYCSNSTYDVIRQHITDEELIAVLCGQFGDYGPPPKEAPFFIHASIVNHYINGGYFPKGGPSAIAESICKFIYEKGGQVLVGKPVEEIVITNNKATGVIINDIEINANEIISAVGVRNTFTKLAPQVTDYDEVIDNIPPSVCHFYCFVNLEGAPEEHNLRSANMWIYPHRNYDKVMEDFLKDPFNAPIPLFMGFSSKKDETWSERYPDKSNAIILTVAKKEWFEEWEQEKCTNRSEEYNDIKNKLGKRLLEEGLFRFYPELKDKVIDVDYATPLTSQFYLNAQDGESYGMDMNKYRLLEGSILRPRTNVSGLFLSGQDICTLGFTGAMMAGVLTASAILGYDSLWHLMRGKNIISNSHKN